MVLSSVPFYTQEVNTVGMAPMLNYLDADSREEAELQTLKSAEDLMGEFAVIMRAPRIAYPA
jgi:hypothetical protein